MCYTKKELWQEELRPSPFSSLLQQFGIVGDKFPHTNGVLMEVFSNLPCVHALTAILGHDRQELRLEVLIEDVVIMPTSSMFLPTPRFPVAAVSTLGLVQEYSWGIVER